MNPDWQQRWFVPLREAAAAPPPELPVRFIPATELPAGEAYIARTRCVPTRDNPHDAFNRLAWHRHPALKLRLNSLQAAEIAAHGIGPTRGALRDALTLFEEHVALGDPRAWPADAWARKPFLPLPVLGIPGWWPANEDPAFYADAKVFRPSRLKAGAPP